jgi:hypothetical protein
MRKVLVFVLVLFCLILAMPLVSANPISPAHEANSQLAFVYPAITILGVVLADLAIYLIRRKSINKHSFLHILTLSLIISLLVFYGRILTSGEHRISDISWNLVINSFTIFGYITMAVTLAAIADSVVYLIRRRGIMG